MEPIDDYVIIKKSLLEDRINLLKSFGTSLELTSLKYLLEQSKPLKPEMSKAMYRAKDLMRDSLTFSPQINGWFLSFELDEKIEHYLTNLTI